MRFHNKEEQDKPFFDHNHNRRVEDFHVRRINQLVVFNGKRHLSDMGKAEMERFFQSSGGKSKCSSAYSIYPTPTRLI